MLDALDHKIIDCLVHQGRMTWSELAHLLGLSAPAAAERVRRLEEKGIIKGYTAIVNAKSIGYSLKGFIFVSLGHPRHRPEFLKAVEILYEVQECHHIAGEDDYLLKVCCQDTEHLNSLLDQIKSLAGVLKTRSIITLSTIKESLSIPIKQGN